ncbi:MAG: hypothetical protein H6Q89_1943 [Myxococcaceae bacterium]|nr:hypothetical protein [Myxococcaceae bacterium]
MEPTLCHCHQYAAQPTDFVPLYTALEDWSEEQAGFLRRAHSAWHLPAPGKGEHNRSEACYECTLCGRRWRVTRTSVFSEDFRKWEEVTGSAALAAHYVRPAHPPGECPCRALPDSPRNDPSQLVQAAQLKVARVSHEGSRGRIRRTWAVCTRCNQRWRATTDLEATPAGVFRWEAAGGASDDRYFLDLVAYSPAQLQRVIAELALPVALDLAGCEICRALPINASRFEVRGEVANDIPAEARHLGVVLKLEDRDGLMLQRCPRCHRLYLASHSYEYLVGGATEDEDTLERVDAAGATEKMLAYLNHFVGLGSLYRQGPAWVVSFQPAG